LKEELKKKRAEDMLSESSLSHDDDLALSVFDVSGSPSDDIIIQGSLIKQNWYNKL